MDCISFDPELRLARPILLDDACVHEEGKRPCLGKKVGSQPPLQEGLGSAREKSPG